eukprot:s288_g40.t1
MPKNSKIAWRSFPDASAAAPAEDPSCDAPTALPSNGSSVALDAALAGLGVGRKLCRQLRAELKLEEDSFGCLLRYFRRDQRRVESAVSRLLPKVSEQVICLLEVESFEASPSPTARGEIPVDFVAPVAIAAGNEFEEVWKALPKMLPGENSERQGHEERGRALRRRLKATLTEEAQQQLKAALAQLRDEGLSGADDYLTAVWEQLQVLEHDIRVDLMVEIIMSQAQELQRALRGAVERKLSTPPTPSAASKKPRPRGRGEILVLPEVYLLQMLSYCCASADLSRFGACCAALRGLAVHDALWCLAWRCQGLPRQVPETQVRRRMLMYLASQCVDCGELTDFEHAILGCRLCERCERSHAKYALIRSSLAIREFQLPLAAMQQLPGVDGSTGRVYLRSMVQQLAERQHTQESLQQLRAKNDLGHSTCGRQRRQTVEKRSSRPSGMPKPSKEDTDPCCFEATALRRADADAEDDEGLQRQRLEFAKDLPRSLRKSLAKR